MSVIVKGMEMPNKCCECNIRYEMFCPLLHRFIADEGRRHNCPLGDVPTPHGDLIDAFAFRREMDTNYPFDKFTQSKYGEANAAKSTILMMLGKAPTIIKAEE